jgi:Domain of unknown function (DUF6894)
MPRYFFDLRDHDGVVTDEEGMELPSLDAVQEEAARALADMARDEVPLAGNGPARHMAIEVRDDDGPVLHARFTFEIKRIQ